MNIKSALPILSDSVDSETKQTIDLRKVHAWLQVKTRFNDWMRKRITDNEFEQHIDFITILNSQYSPPRKEYHATLDMAKELCMLEQNAKGREARKYFIACEKVAKEAQNKVIRVFPYHVQRYLDRKETVPIRHFAAIEIVSNELVLKLEKGGVSVREEMEPERSFVRSWNPVLRAQGYVIEAFPTHQIYTRQGVQVNERCYPISLIGEATDHFWDSWMPDKAPKYLKYRQPELLGKIPVVLNLEKKLGQYRLPTPQGRLF